MPDETNILSMECTDVCKCRGFAERLFMIQSQVIIMMLKRTMKMIMLTTMLRIFDADYQTLCLIA